MTNRAWSRLGVGLLAAASMALAASTAVASPDGGPPESGVVERSHFLFAPVVIDFDAGLIAAFGGDPAELCVGINFPVVDQTLVHTPAGPTKLLMGDRTEVRIYEETDVFALCEAAAAGTADPLYVGEASYRVTDNNAFGVESDRSNPFVLSASGTVVDAAGARHQFAAIRMLHWDADGNFRILKSDVVIAPET